MTRKVKIVSINISIKYTVLEKNENLLGTKIHYKKKQKAINQFSCIVKLLRCFGILDCWCILNCINGHRF